jgi:hypothetical protein
MYPFGEIVHRAYVHMFHFRELSCAIWRRKEGFISKNKRSWFRFTCVKSGIAIATASRTSIQLQILSS